MEVENQEMEVSGSEADSDEEKNTSKPKVYLPGEEIGEGEELVYDESAYMMYHQAQTGRFPIYRSVVFLCKV